MTPGWRGCPETFLGSAPCCYSALGAAFPTPPTWGSSSSGRAQWLRASGPSGKPDMQRHRGTSTPILLVLALLSTYYCLGVGNGRKNSYDVMKKNRPLPGTFPKQPPKVMNVINAQRTDSVWSDSLTLQVYTLDQKAEVIRKKKSDANVSSYSLKARPAHSIIRKPLQWRFLTRRPEALPLRGWNHRHVQLKSHCFSFLFYVYLAFMYICAPRACLVLSKAGRGYWIP